MFSLKMSVSATKDAPRADSRANDAGFALALSLALLSFLALLVLSLWL